MHIERTASRTWESVAVLSFETLPNEMIMAIFRNLNWSDLVNVSCVSRKFKLVVCTMLQLSHKNSILTPLLLLLNTQLAALKQIKSRQWFFWRRGPFAIEGITDHDVIVMQTLLNRVDCSLADLYKQIQTYQQNTKRIIAFQKKTTFKRKCLPCCEISGLIVMCLIYFISILYLSTNYPLMQC